MHVRLIFSLKPKHKEVLERGVASNRNQRIGGDFRGRCMTTLTFPSLFCPLAVTLDKASQCRLSDDE